MTKVFYRTEARTEVRKTEKTTFSTLPMSDILSRCEMKNDPPATSLTGAQLTYQMSKHHNLHPIIIILIEAPPNESDDNLIENS